jgi:putative endonuclease
MATHIIKGRTGEWLAADYLQSLGYKILCCNWKHRQYEIDIIAVSQGVLHIIEVKTRHSGQFGEPEEAVSGKKFRNLQKAASQFLELNPCWKRIQFDVIAIRRSFQQDKYVLIEDIYF